MLLHLLIKSLSILKYIYFLLRIFSLFFYKIFQILFYQIFYIILQIILSSSFFFLFLKIIWIVYNVFFIWQLSLTYRIIIWFFNIILWSLILWSTLISIIRSISTTWWLLNFRKLYIIFFILKLFLNFLSHINIIFLIILTVAWHRWFIRLLNFYIIIILNMLLKIIVLQMLLLFILNYTLIPPDY